MPTAHFLVGVHTAVAVLDEAFRSGQAIVSQDFVEVFDGTIPELSIHALRKAGIAPEPATALEWVWAHQVRWLCFEHYVHPQAQEVCTSLPQGDPLSLLGLLRSCVVPWSICSQTCELDIVIFCCMFMSMCM